MCSINDMQCGSHKKPVEIFLKCKCSHIFHLPYVCTTPGDTCTVRTKPLSVTLPLGLSCVLCGPDGTESVRSTGSPVDRPEGQ